MEKEKILIFSGEMIEKHLRDDRSSLMKFFYHIRQLKLSSIFLTKAPEEFYENMQSSVIQLGFPAILSEKSITREGQEIIYPALLEESVSIKKIIFSDSKGIVIADCEKYFQNFTEDFKFILVQKNKRLKKDREEFTAVASLLDVLPVLQSVSQ